MNDCWRWESSPDVSIRSLTHPIRVHLAATQSQSWLVIIVSSQNMGDKFLRYMKKTQKESGEELTPFSPKYFIHKMLILMVIDH